MMMKATRIPSALRMMTLPDRRDLLDIHSLHMKELRCNPIMGKDIDFK